MKYRPGILWQSRPLPWCHIGNPWGHIGPGALKMREWKYRHASAGVDSNNAFLIRTTAATHDIAELLESVIKNVLYSKTCWRTYVASASTAAAASASDTGGVISLWLIAPWFDVSSSGGRNAIIVNLVSIRLRPEPTVSCLFVCRNSDAGCGQFAY